MKLLVNVEDVVNSKASSIYYSANTIWWTHDKDDLCKPSEEHLEKMKSVFGEMAAATFTENPLPLDAFNCPLYQTDNIKAFVDTEKINKHEAYGPADKRVECFMWSHAKNMNLIMDALKEKSQTDKKVLTRFQNFYELLVELGIFQ